MHTQTSAVDFSTVLYVPETLHEVVFDGDYIIMYAPDFQGWPLRVPNRVRTLLDRFRGGTSAGSIVTSELHPDGAWESLEELVDIISELENRGFLRSHPARLPYVRTPPSDGPPRSISVWLHVTNNCNLACSYCFVEEKSRETMHNDTIERTAARLASTVRTMGIDTVTVKFAGGEPTLALPSIEAFRARLDSELADSSVAPYYSILTNGTLLTPRLLRFLEMPRTSISVSVDGYAEAHDIHRRTLRTFKPTWCTVSTNIDTLIQHGVSPYMMITITRETVASLPKIVDWTLRRGLRMRIGVVRDFHPAEYLKSDVDYCQRLIEAFDETFRLLEADSTIQCDPRAIEICELGFESPSQWLCCGLGSNHIVIRTDGTVTRCPMTVHETGLEDENLVHACREAASALNMAEREDPCLSCQWFPVCVGGCPVANERTIGTPKGPSPLCDFYRFVIPRFAEFFVRCQPRTPQRQYIDCCSKESD